MLIVTTESVNGGRFEQLGLVRGSSIMTVHAGKDIMNSFKTLVGGELTSYNEMMENARGLATQRMIEQAQSMGRGTPSWRRATTAAPWPRARQR